MNNPTAEAIAQEEIMSLLANAYDNLNDLPVNEDWARRWCLKADKFFPLPPYASRAEQGGPFGELNAIYAQREHGTEQAGGDDLIGIDPIAFAADRLVSRIEADEAQHPQRPDGGEWRHVANEWADSATSGLQWLRNIRDGISTQAEAMRNMIDSIAHCMEVQEAASAPPAVGEGDWQKTLRHIKDCAKQARVDAVGACDALYELAVKHGATELVAAGFAHNVNGSIATLEHDVHLAGTNVAAVLLANTAPPSREVGDALVTTLAEVRDLLASRPADCLGTATLDYGQTYPIRDEVIDRITKSLSAAPRQFGGEAPAGWRTAIARLREGVSAGSRSTSDMCNEQAIAFPLLDAVEEALSELAQPAPGAVDDEYSDRLSAAADKNPYV